MNPANSCGLEMQRKSNTGQESVQDSPELRETIHLKILI